MDMFIPIFNTASDHIMPCGTLHTAHDTTTPISSVSFEGCYVSLSITRAGVNETSSVIFALPLYEGEPVTIEVCNVKSFSTDPKWSLTPGRKLSVLEAAELTWRICMLPSSELVTLVAEGYGTLEMKSKHYHASDLGTFSSDADVSSAHMLLNLGSPTYEWEFISLRNSFCCPRAVFVQFEFLARQELEIGK
jgi:hypothetical protein